MKEQKHITCDIVVIGAGLSGMAAAARASELGLKTVQVGASSTLLFASGLFDYLGVYPLESRRVLNTPKNGLEQMCSDIPDHPYAKAGHEQILNSFNFIKQFLHSAGLFYSLPQENNHMVLTSAGTFKPTFMMPLTFFKGANLDHESKKLLIVDFKGLRDFSAQQVVHVAQ
ncbi:MAG: FAD-binding protein, partial [Desulfobacteraceae bacterium]|nr:FAD-binding protein [Desulfobacteraceae bacterium]